VPQVRENTETPGIPPSSRRAPSLDPRLLELLNESFAKCAGKDHQLDSADLKRALRVRDEFLAQRVFAILDRDGSGNVCRTEFLEAVRRLVFGSPREKLRLAFQIHDLDGNGRIEADELRRMIALNLTEEAGSEASGAHSTRSRAAGADQLAALLLSTADDNLDGALSFEEFERVTCADPRLFALIAKSEASWLAPDAELLASQARHASFSQRLGRLLENRLPYFAFFALWSTITTAFFLTGALAYRSAGVWVMLAHGCGAALNFNAALVLVPVSRRLLSWVRSSRLGRFLPLDDAQAIHRFLGHVLFGLALVHTYAHFANYRESSGIIAGLVYTRSGQTGGFLLLASAVMWGFSLPYVRKSGRYELFYRAHLLYVVWFGLLLAHGPRFWKFALAPLLAFAFEQAWRRWRRASEGSIVKLTGLKSEVSRLELARAAAFEHRAGDYAFLRIPHLAKHEWHPFTISSAPSAETLTFHIRSEGNWTSALRRLADTPGVAEGLAVQVDGPYGSPSAHVFESRCAVMVGAGIGVTPFASVLECLAERAKAGESELKKLYFFWLNRDSRSFEWFAELLLRLEQLDEPKLVDIQICMTGGRGNVAAAALNLARNLSHDIGKPDFVTGLRTQTRVGAPDFDHELAEIAARHAPDRVDVFYCGPPGLGKKLARTCRRLALGFRQESF
jgi:predicted ferric reductase/Ca2+-binding EF-hand superfamily protein